MLFGWDEQTIRWFLDASAYTGFHKTLARKIAPYLKPDDTLCDLGCGLGRLDLELAPYVSRLTAVDINETAIELLRRDIGISGRHNMSAECADAGALRGNFDVLLTSFFGEANTSDFLKLCTRKLIRVVHMDNKGRLYPGQPRYAKKDTVETVRLELIGMGADFKLETASVEFGQPLGSWGDAVLFVRNNAPDAGDDEIERFLRENTERTDREDFPFYLPNPKEFGIFVIEKEA